MPKQTFIAFYIATFLATYDALNYDMNCMAGKTASMFNRPMDDVAELAASAWEKLEQFTKGPVQTTPEESSAKVA